MKSKIMILMVALLALSGCSLLFGSPSATVRAFMAAAKKGDSEAMTKLFSSKAIAKLGEDTIRSNNKNFAEMSQTAHASGRTYSMNQLSETKTGDSARVSFFYQSNDKTDSIKFVFDLSKESGVWKIDDVGGADKEETKASEQPSPAPSTEVPPPPPPPLANSSPANSPQQKPISGGVLNGKAISLPKPAYSPAARAVKATGTVVVQVTVDEQGKVTSATAVSGHPLLRASAVSAAYSARFSPTVLAGKPVKITGVITYNFALE